MVDRTEFLVNLARRRHVVDLGFVDEGRMTVKRNEGVWLHAELRSVAAHLVGIDADSDGVGAARELGYDVYRADCQSSSSIRELGLEPGELVIAGELIEHLDRPGDFLEAVKSLVAPEGSLVLTTPNGLSLTNAAAGLIGRELVNPDHVAWFSPQTLRTLLGRHGWHVLEFRFYRFPSVRDATASGTVSGPQAYAFRLFQQLAQPVFRLRPWLADGLILIARRA